MNDNLWTNEQVAAMFECNEKGCKVPPPKVTMKEKKVNPVILPKSSSVHSPSKKDEDEEELLKRKRLERSQFFKRPSCKIESISTLIGKVMHFIGVDSVDKVPVPEEQRQMILWAFYASCLPTDKDTLQKEFVKHVEYTLALTHNQLTPFASYQALSLCLKDRLVERWKDTETFFQQQDTKMVNYLSMEYLLGRSLQSVATNLRIKSKYSRALKNIGVDMEDLYEEEADAGLGNGGLGRLAACFMDSLATLDYPAWGYGLRYTYGMFAQSFSSEGDQVETPDYWLNFGTPWEIQRLDVTYPIRFCGSISECPDTPGKWAWDGGEIVIAVAYDMPVPGFGTQNTLNIRLWSSKPSSGFDLESFNKGDYMSAIANKQTSENITNVLYPDDTTMMGKELRLKQEYFFVAATMRDIMTRFKKRTKPIEDFPSFMAIQLNDTHPCLGIAELMRILVDEENVPWNKAWLITQKTFSYTNHTVLPEALECWPVSMLEWLLPRHMKIIYDINHMFLRYVDLKWPGDVSKARSLSIIRENPKNVRMGHLAIIGSHCINGVARIHTDLLKTTVFPDFYELWPEKFQNKTNGVTPRRWVFEANPFLSHLITNTLAVGHEWVVDTRLLSGLESFCENKLFQFRWMEAKRKAKERLATFIQSKSGVRLNTTAIFDIQAKRIHEYKRQLLNCLGVIWRWLKIRETPPERRSSIVPRVVIIGGKAAPGYKVAKLILKLFNRVAAVVNADQDVADLLKVVIVPNYGVSLAELLIPASDLSEHISTAGTEASGTSNMKFGMNGGLIIGTMDGANVEIAEEIGAENMFIFGATAQEVPGIRASREKRPMSPDLAAVIGEIRKGTFGPPDMYSPILHSLTDEDYYLVAYDFDIEAQQRVDEDYVNKELWAKKSILSVARMGKFSSDRTIYEYARDIWGVKPCRKSGPASISIERLSVSGREPANEKSPVSVSESTSEDETEENDESNDGDDDDDDDDNDEVYEKIEEGEEEYWDQTHSNGEK